ncbi:MAG: hypothetical protein QOJ29_2788, partial [Thermoleophilaceae bacterium]|nr:hypothetical protein [Thermoleophilaceae bacterium]
GGARHPTELGIALDPGWGELAGQWWYDSSAHTLDPGRVPYVANGESLSGSAVFSVTSRVERAMWRYRDVRAFRPVLYDAGHIVETLITVIRLAGWSAQWVVAPAFIEDGGTADVAVGYVVANRSRASVPTAVQASSTCEDATDVLRTNPFVSLALKHDDLLIANHLEPSVSLPATATMIDALAYATPSSRRDRPTDPVSIGDATSLNAEELGMLRDKGLLLDEAKGDRLWQGLVPWSNHDWYLSALLHAEATASGPRRNRDQTAAGSGSTSDPALITALDRRRTSRSLHADPLPADVSTRVLQVLDEQLEVAVIISTPIGLGSLPAGVHALSANGAERLRDEALAEEDITRAAIGQPWARGFSCAIWLLPVFVDGTPADWESHMVDCGRLAQRIALAASHDASVGVFQSPAMVDAELASLLPDHATLDGAYLVGLGITDGRDASSREVLFRVRDLLRSSP